MEEKNTTGGMLAGIRVLDLCDEKADFCSRLLASMGAYVIKVERPGGSSSRFIGPFHGKTHDHKKSLSFLHNNINKSGITLNLESEKGREIFIRLVKKADILVESFSPGYLRTLNLDYNSLIKTNPILIMVSITGFGQTGPRKGHKSCDLIASSTGGQAYVSGSPGSSPIKPFGGQLYYTGSLYAAIGIMLALRKRQKIGKGEYIDISLQESAVSTLDHVLPRYFQENFMAGRHGNRHWNDFFCVLKCKDGFIHLTPFEQWETLVEWLDSDGMAGDLRDEKWKNEDNRRRNADHVLEIIEKWTMKHTMNELVETAQLMRLPWAPVCSPKDILESPQLKSRDFYNEIHAPEITVPVKLPGLPFKTSEGFSIPAKTAPEIGGDNLRIYVDELGYSSEEVEEFEKRGVI